MEYNDRRLRTLLPLVALLLLGYWGLQNLDLLGSTLTWCINLIMPFIIGSAIAFILHVPMRIIERSLPKSLKTGRRGIAFMLTLLGVITLFSLLTGLVVPQIAITITTLGNRLPTFWASLLLQIDTLLLNVPALEGLFGELSIPSWDVIAASTLTFLKEGGFQFLSDTVSAASGIFGGIIDSIVSFIFCIYILFQKETLARQCRMLLYAFCPKHRAAQAVRIGKLTEKTFSSFLTGQCLEACILGAIFAVAMFFAGMPYISLISVLIAFTALIPLVGAFIGCIVGALLIAVDDPMKAFWFIIMFLVIQQLEGNLIYPRVVGNSVGLPSMWVLVAVTLGAGIGGVTGMLVMIPLCSVLYTLLREKTYEKLRERGTLDVIFPHAQLENDDKTATPPVDNCENL